MADKRLILLHHSHTDIGYTELQSRITGWHVDFIRQALRIIQDNTTDTPFKWNCETFWAVEKFLEVASENEKAALAEAIQKGYIGLSASYLNFSEVLNQPVMDRLVKRAVDYAESIGVNIDSAMTADINGYGWSFSQTLYDNGVQNLFSCVHTHHGMYPVGKYHRPFWWETPAGDQILVWNGHHYHYGNELGLAPDANSSYMTKDECDAETIYTDYWKVAETRIPRVWEELEKENYPYDFLPVMISGLRTDNSPPSAKIIEAVSRWNKEHGDICTIEMKTLSEFFGLLRKANVDIPVFSGDWPDWWTDGTACAPDTLRVFREAQRGYELLKELCKSQKLEINPFDPEIDTLLGMYAEHTYGASYSVTRPWELKGQAISARKKAYAALAYDKVEEKLDSAYREMGHLPLQTDISFHYTVINPQKIKIAGTAVLPVGHYEYHELLFGKKAKILDESGCAVLHQLVDGAQNMEFHVPVELESGEKKSFTIEADEEPLDSFKEKRIPLKENVIESGSAKICFDDTGITSWMDKDSGRELLRKDYNHPAFSLLYENTPMKDESEVWGLRGSMGQNRRLESTKQYVSKIDEVNRIASGPFFNEYEFTYTIKGADNCKLRLRIPQNGQYASISIRMNKQSDWSPENMFCSIPFNAGDKKTQIILDKFGAKVRPRIDQLPGTLVDFYAFDKGISFVEEDDGVSLASLDANLLQLGPLTADPRKLHDPQNANSDNALPYIWLMTNYWETNFDASLGGFHEFRFIVQWGKGYSDESKSRRELSFSSHNLTVIRTKKE